MNKPLDSNEVLTFQISVVSCPTITESTVRPMIKAILENKTYNHMSSGSSLLLKDFINNCYLKINLNYCDTQQMAQIEFSAEDVSEYPNGVRRCIEQISRSICTILVYTSSSQHSFDYVKDLYQRQVQHFMRDDLSFGYLVGVREKADQRVDQEEASDFAFGAQVLFNEVNLQNGSNIDLLLKTLRTRASRLIGDIGTNLCTILANLQPAISLKQLTDEDVTAGPISDLASNRCDVQSESQSSNGKTGMDTVEFHESQEDGSEDESKQLPDITTEQSMN